MIYVTCGHEQGIGLEVFLKAYSSLGKLLKNQFKLLGPEKLLKSEISRIGLTINDVDIL